MADILVKHLKKKGEEHSSLAMLVNQWGFDEKLIPKALQNVGSLFPHYSRHDESHSKQILVNIERLLGNNIELLTATDTWLLLEAAYLHDIGMVVPRDHLEEAVRAPGFRNYLDEIIASPHHELNKFAACFDVNDTSKCFSGASTPLKAIENFRQLMAEWFRRQHAGRANSIVQTPWETIGVSSPRTELIPMRLFRVLGKICHIHGAPFEDLFKPDGLPFREAGLGQEDCHPRFVACLLRMGDLLDMDDNRFCPVMQRIAGDDRPGLSKAHEDKHSAIRHLRLDQERIEVTAECDTIEGYVETFKWFDWLKKEVQDQMANWRDIVPDRALGLLPTLGKTTVRLKNNLQVLQAGQRPRFSVDGSKVIELLQGDNLYDSKYACIRELLQNAVDATLIKMWITDLKKKDSSIWERPDGNELQECFDRHQIDVELALAPDVVASSADKATWRLKISDCGTGVSSSDLHYMLQIGGSQKNLARQRIVKEMPEWMRPSGAFGIGLQSAFLIAERIVIRTKSLFSGESLCIDMYSPLGGREGVVSIEVLNGDLSVQCGTSIEIYFELDVIAKSWDHFRDPGRSISASFAGRFDPVLDDRFHFEAAVLADRVNEFSMGSMVPVFASFFTEDDSIDICKGRQLFVKSEDEDEWRFVRVDGNEMFLRYELVESRDDHTVEARYRGQLFDAEMIVFPCVEVHFNLLSGKAGSWLNASRDTVAAEAVEHLEVAVLGALVKLVEDDISKNYFEDLPLLSFFLETMGLRYGGAWLALAEKVKCEWLGLTTQEHGGEVFKSFFDKDTFVVRQTQLFLVKSSRKWIYPCDFYVEDYRTLEIMVRTWVEYFRGFVKIVDVAECKSFLGKDFGKSKLAYDGSQDDVDKGIFNGNLYYLFDRSFSGFYSEAALATALKSRAYIGWGNQRFLLPVEKNSWPLLTLQKELPARVRSLFDIDSKVAEWILLPFLFTGDKSDSKKKVQCSDRQLEELCKWLRRNSQAAASASFEDVKLSYLKLIQYIDDVVMNSPRHADDWKRLRGL